MSQVLCNFDSKMPLIDLEGRHVAMLTRWFARGGGLELYCHRLVEELLKREMRITVICEENKSDFSHSNLEVIDYGAPLKKLSKGDTYRYAFKKTREVLERINKVDIIHSQQLPCFKHDVVTFHNHTINRLSNVGLNWEQVVNKTKASFADRYQTKMLFDKRLCLESTCRIFVSSIEKDEYYEEFKLDPQAPYVIAYPGATINDAEFDVIEQEEDDGINEFERVDRFPFMFVGKGYRMKGLDILFKACRNLKEDGIEFELNIVGLEKKPILKASLLRHKIEDRVKFKGYVSDMEQAYKQAYAIVTPSRLESFGMAPLQAMAHGLVPIVSRVSGISEVIDHASDGLILEDHLDARELAEHMKRLTCDLDLFKKCAENVKTKARQFTWSKTADATALAYKYVLNNRKRKTTSEISFKDTRT